MKIWRRFSEVFNWMPIAAIVDNKIFCVHGGLSPNLASLEDIAKLDRPLEVPEEGLVCDLMWSDPDPDLSEDFGENERGASVTFGIEVVNRFCDKYGFDLICRAHQVVMEGFDFPFREEQRLVTIFSAPNYCNEFKNKGAILKVDDQLYCTFVLLDPILEEENLEGEQQSGTPPRGWIQEVYK
jgi:serine/threonine-protein phosphatase PP1 catalytic subunit